MNVLSLFDGISCGQLALKRAGIKYDRYFASEIDKYAIKVTRHHFPETIQLGDIRGVHAKDLPPIDILIGGSPCTGFSKAGKGLNFDDPQSKLFFEYVRLLEETKPAHFLLENVVMKKEWQDTISKYLGVEPIEINSSLVSAQNRRRLYWANWKIEQPLDKQIHISDILDKSTDGEFLMSSGWHKWFNHNKDYQLSKQYCKILGGKDKAVTMTTRQYASWNGNFVGCAVRNQVTKNGVQEQLNIRSDGKSNCVVPTFTNRLNCVGKLEKETMLYRRLTPVECERLQTIDDGYTSVLSNYQQYRVLGNAWTVDVVAHILRSLHPTT